MILDTAPTVIASNVSVLSATAADLQDGDVVLHGVAHVTRIVRNLHVFQGRHVFDAYKIIDGRERRMGEWTLKPEADVLILRPAD